MTPLPIPMIDLINTSLDVSFQWSPHYNRDYQLRWGEIGEAILETSWDFIEGRQERTMLAWTNLFAIQTAFENLLYFVRANKLW